SPVGGVAPLNLWFVVLSVLAVEDGHTSDVGQLAHRDGYRFPVAVRRKRRGLRCGTDCALGSNRVAGGYGFAVDGSDRLVAARWSATCRPRPDRLAAGLRGSCVTCGAEGSRRISTHQSRRGRDSRRGVVCLGLRLAL